MFSVDSRFFVEFDSRSPVDQLGSVTRWFDAAANIGTEGSNAEMAGGAAGWVADPINDARLRTLKAWRLSASVSTENLPGKWQHDFMERLGVYLSHHGGGQDAVPDQISHGRTDTRAP